LTGNGQGGKEHEHVFFGGHEQAVFPARVADLRGVGFVFDFDADGEAFAVDGGFAFEGHLREPGEEVLAELVGVFEKLIPVARQIAEVGQGSGDGARVPAIGGIEAEVFFDRLATLDVVMTAPRPP
jgi:hypothetical protein